MVDIDRCPCRLVLLHCGISSHEDVGESEPDACTVPMDDEEDESKGNPAKHGSSIGTDTVTNFGSSSLLFIFHLVLLITNTFILLLYPPVFENPLLLFVLYKDCDIPDESVFMTLLYVNGCMLLAIYFS